MSKLIQFGENVPGYAVRVLNEREIRAAAGILFLFTYTSLLFILFAESFVLIKYVISFFLLDFLIRVFVNPRFSPSLIVGRLIVRKQAPEYVGAPQKRFAWMIGVFLSAVMFVLMVVVNSYSPVTGIICLICMVFLFAESVFGICLGCKFYPLFYKTKASLCAGEVCNPTPQQPIQKIAPAQLWILAFFIASVFLTAHFFNDAFRKKAHDLFASPVTVAKTK